jgi:hypothetical protein
MADIIRRFRDRLQKQFGVKLSIRLVDSRLHVYVFSANDLRFLPGNFEGLSVIARVPSVAHARTT